MLKENKQRADEKEALRAEKAAFKDENKRMRHQEEIMAIREELAEWEMKRSELEKANKDPGNQAGIETIIALLKDQMVAQEQKLADLREAVTPQMASINDDAAQAIDDMKDQMASDFAAFSKDMDSEVKKTLYEVAALRDQKKQLQTDIADLLAFKAKVSSVGAAPCAKANGSGSMAAARQKERNLRHHLRHRRRQVQADLLQGVLRQHRGLTRTNRYMRKVCGDRDDMKSFEFQVCRYFL